MGVVNQIKDLDNSSKPLPYKNTERFIVGEGHMLLKTED